MSLYHEIDTNINNNDDIGIEMQSSSNEYNHINNINDISVSSSSINNTENNHHAIIQLNITDNIKDYFENEWLPTIYDKVKSYEGFRNRHVMKLDNVGGTNNYVIILIFDSLQNFKNWQMSEDRNEMVGLIRSKGGISRHINAYGDIIQDELEYSDNINKDVESGNVNGNGNIARPMSRIATQNRLTSVPRPLPPPRWKLCCLLVLGVYVSLIIVDESGLSPALAHAGLPPSFIIFINVCMLVSVLVYSFMPLMMSIPFVNSWIRAKRSCPVNKMHPIAQLLDQGLQMFAVKEANFSKKEIPKNILDKFHKMEVKLDKLRDINYNLRNELRMVTGKTRSVSISGATNAFGVNDEVKTTEQVAETLLKAKGKQCSDLNVNSAEGCGHLTMAVHHFVRWEFIHDFEKWTDAMDEEMKKFTGYMGMIRLAPTADGEPFINSFTFDSFEHLMIFSQSQYRAELLRKLTPMLEATSAYALAEERMLSDAFTELFVATGATVSSRPPPLWKTVMLIIIPLHIIVWQIGFGLVPYLTQYELDSYLILFLTTVVNVFVNSYIGQPLLNSEFGEWLHMSRKEHTFVVYHYLDVGLPFYGQIAVFILFYGLLILFGNI